MEIDVITLYPITSLHIEICYRLTAVAQSLSSRNARKCNYIILSNLNLSDFMTLFWNYSH